MTSRAAGPPGTSRVPGTPGTSRAPGDGHTLLLESLAESAARSPEAVTRLTARLIRDGALPVGSRLPTIRDLAGRSGLSTRTVSSAWSALRRDGLIETNRRGGTIVARPGRSDPSGPADWTERDLLTGSPDYTLQPDLSRALLAGLQTEELNRPGRDYITTRLRTAVEDGWPFPAQAYVAAGGGSEGLLLAVESVAPPGSVVAVELPIMPGFRDTLTDVGFTVVGIDADHEGALASSLAVALQATPAVVVLQPEGGYATGGALTEGRARELAAVLAAAPQHPWIVEDDAVGPLATRQAASLGTHFPDRTVRVRSYCKAYGMDIRTCVIGGSADMVEKAIRTRVHGIAANSRILQNALAHLVTDTETAGLVERARQRYAHRRENLVRALTERGLRAHAGPHSLVVWVQVRHETGSLLALARRGIVVGAGSKSYVDDLGHGLLRVAVPQLPDDPEQIGELADALRTSSEASDREFPD